MRRQLIHLSIIVTLSALALSIVLSAASIAADNSPYPAMPAGDATGSITGRVTNTDGVGISGASVSIVNSSNLSIVYAQGQTDSSGYYGISGVNSTGGGYWYRVYAKATGYSDAYSIPVCIESANTCTVNTLTLGGSGPTPTPTASPTPRPGNVSGQVTLAGYGETISGATVTLVNGLDAFFTYNTTHTDSQGRYLFENVEAIGAPGYRVHVEKDGFVEVYSAPFNVNQGAAVKVSMAINRVPEATPVNTITPTPAVSSPTPAPTETPRATPPPGTDAAFPGAPGFIAITALAGFAIACAAARKR